MMQQTYFQGSRPRLVVSDKKIFLRFPYISLCKTCGPQDVATFKVAPQGHNLIKLSDNWEYNI